MERIGLDADVRVTKSTYYVEGSVSIHGTGKSSSSHTFISVIAEGSIKINGNGKYKPANDSKIQFVTNGDFELLGNADADDPTDLDGQIMVREQLSVTGNSEFQGRIMVEDRNSATNAYNAATNPNGRRNASVLSSNTLTGSMVVTYNGSLGGITVETAGGSPDVYEHHLRMDGAVMFGRRLLQCRDLCVADGRAGRRSVAWRPRASGRSSPRRREEKRSRHSRTRILVPARLHNRPAPRRQSRRAT